MGSLKEYKNIKIEIKDHVGCLTLQRSEANNALNIETSKEIYDGCKTLESHSSIRVIFIQGNQKLFSPGADIKELNSLTKTTANEKGLFNFFDKMNEIQIPIIASIEGYALGGGMELSLLCDIIIASKESKFGQPEINLGVIPGIGGTQRLKFFLGKHNAHYLCMSGDIISGQRAYDLGLVNILLEKENYASEALKVAEKISQKPKSSLIEIKKLISQNHLLEQGLKTEREAFYRLLDHENAKLGMEAFLNKTKVNWKD